MNLLPNQQDFLKNQALELKMAASYLKDRLHEVQPVDGSDNPPDIGAIANKLDLMAENLELFASPLNRIH